MSDLNQCKYYAASIFQKGIYLKHLHSTKGVRPCNCHIERNFKHLDSQILQQAIDTIIDRHEVIRTTLVDIDGEIKQKVWPFSPAILKVEIIDLSRVKRQKNKLFDFIQAFLQSEFLPDQYPWLKVAVIKLSRSKYKLIMVMPHMITDNHSMDFLLNELKCLYKSYMLNKQISLSPIIQFGEYINSVESLLKSNGEKHKQFWLNILKDIPEKNLSSHLSSGGKEKIRPYTPFINQELEEALGSLSAEAKKSFWGVVSCITKQGAAINIVLNSRHLRTLTKISKVTKTNLEMVIIATFKLLSIRLSGENETIFGLNTNLRDNEELNGTIGFMINTVLLRYKANPDHSFVDFIEDMKLSFFRTLRHKIYPFDMVLSKSDVSLDYVGNVFLNILNQNQVKCDGGK